MIKVLKKDLVRGLSSLVGEWFVSDTAQVVQLPAPAGLAGAMVVSCSTVLRMTSM